MPIPVISGIWNLARRVEDLFIDVGKLVQGLAAARVELRELETRISALEGREELLIEKAKGRWRRGREVNGGWRAISWSSNRRDKRLHRDKRLRIVAFGVDLSGLV
jgi:hypothetical protein